MAFYAPLNEVGLAQDASLEDIELGIYEPGLTPAEKGAQLISAKDRKIAASIIDELRRWEKQRSERRDDDATPEEVRTKLDELARERMDLLEGTPQAVIEHINTLLTGMFGIEEYLRRPYVSDIMFNGHDRLFIEERGVMSQVESPLDSAEDLNHLVSVLALRTDEKRAPTRDDPIIDSRFFFDAPTGKVSVRLNATIGSVTNSGEPSLNLRKPTESGYDKLEKWAEVAEHETDSPLSREAMEFLAACFANRANILVVGGTGSGKTSLLRALLRLVRPWERVVVVEEANELDLRETIDNYVGLVARGDVTIARQVANAMRMRPDRVVVGECRESAEVQAFLRAINTGHAGSITTIHASGAKDGLQAMLTLAGQGSEKISTEHVGRLIRAGIDIVVFLAAVYEDVNESGQARRIRRVMEIATIADFSVVNGVPDFALSYAFGRFVGHGQGSLEVSAPLRNEGFGRLAPDFVKRMQGHGLKPDRLAAILASGTRS